MNEFDDDICASFVREDGEGIWVVLWLCYAWTRSQILSALRPNLFLSGLPQRGEQVNRNSGYFVNYGTAWSTSGQLVGGTVWVQVVNIFKPEQTIQPPGFGKKKHAARRSTEAQLCRSYPTFRGMAPLRPVPVSFR